MTLRFLIIKTAFVLLVDTNGIQGQRQKSSGAATCAVAAVSVWVQRPSRVTGAFHRGLVLLTQLAALQVTATVVHHLTGLVAGVQVKPRGTKTHDSLPRRHGTLVAAAASGHQAQICEGRPDAS